MWSLPLDFRVTSLSVFDFPQGKDILCRARTGSGKTAAYTLPIIQKVLLSKEANANEKYQGAKGLILVPTRELCEQVKDHLKELCYYCSKEVTFIHLPSDVSVESQKSESLTFSSPPSS